jgi:protein disulfide-isomerase
MNKLLCAALLSLAVVAAQAAELKWHTSLPKAKALAKSESKPIFVEFTGSDWCPPCKKLHSEVLESNAFAEFAKGYVLVELDFPRKKEQSDDLKAANKALAKEFKITGYPTVVILDADGKEVSRKVGYGGQSPQEYLADLKK